MMSNTVIFTLHIKNTVKKARDKMEGCWECSSLGSALSCWHSWSLIIYLSSVANLESMSGKTHTSYRSYSITYTYEVTEGKHLNYWVILLKFKLYSPSPLYNIIYLEENTIYGVNQILMVYGRHKIPLSFRKRVVKASPKCSYWISLKGLCRVSVCWIIYIVYTGWYFVTTVYHQYLIDTICCVFF